MRFISVIHEETMKSPQYVPVRRMRSAGRRLASLGLGIGLASAAACAGSSSSPSEMGPTPMGSASAGPPSPDPRVGLRAGLWDAKEALWNMRVVSETRPSEKFLGSTNSDLAFLGNYVIQGNYNGYQIWDISN